jgi:predicted metal-binding protein
VGSKRYADFYRNNGRKRALQVKCWKGTVGLERMLFLEGYYKAFSLVGECCALCKTCAYPVDCRFPQEKRPSVESFSIDVIGTLKNLGTTSQVATCTSDTFNYYGIILLE